MELGGITLNFKIVQFCLCEIWIFVLIGSG